MNRLRLVFTLLMIVACARLAPADDDNPPTDPAQQQSFWMKKKLQWSQEILESLANADWQELGKDARAMRALSKIEGRFRRTDQAEYRTQLAVFDQANEELIQAANEKNLDAATSAYTNLVHSCVNCHKTLRKQNY